MASYSAGEDQEEHLWQTLQCSNVAMYIDSIYNSNSISVTLCSTPFRVTLYRYGLVDVDHRVNYLRGTQNFANKNAQILGMTPSDPLFFLVCRIV